MTTTATQPRPVRAVPAAVPRGNHHVFPVRFSPTLSLSGLLRRPQNSYGWIGPGTLLVDEQGVRVAARRLTLFGLYRTVLFVLPAEIREVYREGDSIWIDLQAGTRRNFFRFWAESAGAAAEIVRRLPTNRTIELEGPACNSGGSSSDAYWSVLSLALAVALLGSLAWLGVERFLSHHGRTPFDAARRAQGPSTIVPGDVVGGGPDGDTLRLAPSWESSLNASTPCRCNSAQPSRPSSAAASRRTSSSTAWRKVAAPVGGIGRGVRRRNQLRNPCGHRQLAPRTDGICSRPPRP